MRNTDDRIREDKPVTPGFLLAVLLWADYRARARDLTEEMKPAEARLHAATDCLAEQQQIIAVPRRFSQFIRDVWQLQERLIARQPRAIARLVGHARFRAAYDFLLLRAEAGDGSVQGEDEAREIAEAADWWTRYQEVGDADRKAMIEERRASAPKKKRRRRRRRKPAADAGQDG